MIVSQCFGWLIIIFQPNLIPCLLQHKFFFFVVFAHTIENKKLYKVRKFKDFSISPAICWYHFLCINTTVSMWQLCPNISYGCTFPTSYPLLHKYFKSLASVAGSQLTYTILAGCIFTTVFSNFSSHPFSWRVKSNNICF